MIVRRATAADAPEIVRIALEVQAVHVAGRPDIFKPGGGEPAEAIAARLDDPRQCYWVAVMDDRVVGYAYARFIDEAESLWRYPARTLVLDQMGVESRHRSGGVGARLWVAVREAAVAAGVARVILNVWSFNRGARRFYERIGFAPYHERMTFELEPPEGSSGSSP